MDDVKRTHRQLPVLIGMEHIMASADIFRTPDKVLIQITANSSDGQLLAEFLEQAEPIGLSFSPLPVRNITEKREAT